MDGGGGGGGGGGVTVVGSDAPSEYHIAPREAENAAGSAPVMNSPVGLSQGLVEGKKRRGRPRKYGPDGGVVALSPKPISSVVPLPPVIDFSSSEKVRKVKPHHGSGSIKQQHQQQQKMELGNSGEWVACSVGANFMLHMITVNAGEDITMKIISFSQQGPRAICILSANGVISSVTLRQPDSSGGTLTYEGRFEILSLSGSFMPSDIGGTRSRSGGMSVSLASPDGRVVGGGVAGLLVAASPVQIVVGSFLTANQHEHKPKKQKPEFIITTTPASSVLLSSLDMEDAYGGQGGQNMGSAKQNLKSSSSFRGDNWSAIPSETRMKPTDINITLPGSYDLNLRSHLVVQSEASF